MTVYADTSFVVSLYSIDKHSASARGLMNMKPVICFTPLHAAEFFHAIGRQVFLGKISAIEAESVYGDLGNDRTSGIWLRTPTRERAFDLCADLGDVMA